MLIVVLTVKGEINPKICQKTEFAREKDLDNLNFSGTNKTKTTYDNCGGRGILKSVCSC